MGTCFLRCIYFTFKPGLVQTHVHQITNMALATFPRNAYFSSNRTFFQATCSHIFLPSNRFHITDFHSAVSLNYIKQNRLKGTLHWTPLFLKKKFQSDEYDIPLDRVGHWREPHVFSFSICVFIFEL